ncbi:ABC1 kinase family protein [Niveibacterium terrae]|uniref:ABC1 kinase family protein n=1 Tax=Niveibacterium terrae TaxID=3373598 RepID=UPI003A8EF9F9
MSGTLVSSAGGVARRLLHVLRVLVRHGFLKTLLGRKHLPRPEQVREAIEELGLTYIKFGQVLAIQRGLLPNALVDELTQLHDKLPAMPFPEVSAIVEAELGAPLSELFTSFCATPLGAASIAQVHEARLADGRRVAVKVQRPKLAPAIAKDIRVLKFLVSLGEKFIPRLRGLHFKDALDELAASLMRETDFHREAASITIFRNTTADLPDVWIPEVICTHSKGSVLTMEFSAGERIDVYAQRHPEAMPQAIDSLVRLMMQTIFEEGLFHADPHPGNVFILPDGRLSLLDFGCTGELDERMRETLAILLEAVIAGDARAATAAYLEMSSDSDQVNRVALQNDIKAVLYQVRRRNISDISIGALLDALVRAGTVNGIRYPGEFVLLSRAIVILEAMIRQLAPAHDYMASFRGQVSRMTVGIFSPERVKEKSGKVARDVARLIGDGPNDLRRILHRVSEGDLGRLPRLEALAERLISNVEQLAGAIIYAALVVSGALLILTPHEHSGKHIVGSIMITLGIIGMLATVFGRARRR